MAKELLAYRLNTIHNVYFFTTFMTQLRQAIKEDRLAAYSKDFFSSQEPRD
jgi:queuine tRNA-ribosyltransferase